MVMSRKASALDRDDILDILSPISGVATSDGTTSTIIDASLIGLNDFFTNNLIEITDGPSHYEALYADSFDPVTGTIGVNGTYSHAITKGIPWRLLLNKAAGIIKSLNPFVDLPWSTYLAQAQLGSVAGDILLPSLIVAGLPGGAKPTTAYMYVKFSAKDNISGLINSISGPQAIQAQNHVAGVWTTGIAFLGGEYSTPIATREGGDVFMPTSDISSQIPGNGGQVDFKWALAQAVANNLNFDDIQVGLMIFYK